MTSTKNILQVCRRYAPLRGGVETHVAQVSKYLIKDGYSVTVLTERTEPDLSQSEVIAGVRVHRITPTLDKLQRWKEIYSVRELFQNSDIVQVHDVGWWLLPVYLFVRNKLYTTFHGWEGYTPIAPAAKIQRNILNRLSKGTIHVGHWIKKWYGDTPTFVTYGGVDTSHKPPQVTLPKQPLTIVFIGRLEPENDIEMYLDLLKKLTETHLYKVIWVGDGSYRQDCEEYGKVTGMIKKPQAYLKKADLVAASSYLSILEAMYSGKLIISLYSHQLKQDYITTFPGSKYLIYSNNINAAYQSLISILSNKKNLPKSLEKAQSFAKDNSWKKLTQQYEKLWST